MKVCPTCKGLGFLWQYSGGGINITCWKCIGEKAINEATDKQNDQTSEINPNTGKYIEGS